MKVYIGSHRRWIGPHQIAETLLFWKDKDNDDIVYKFGCWLADIKWLVNFCQWIYDRKKRKVKVHIHNYDVWNLDNTLAHIILPALIKLRDAKAGSPFIDGEDVPEELRCGENMDEYADENFHKRWEYVLNEMIFAFEKHLVQWEDEFWKTAPKLDLKEYPEDEGQLVTPVRWEVEGECDWEGLKKVENRIQNGFRLFGKYYQTLWT